MIPNRGGISCLVEPLAILLHGFTAMPAETRPLGDYLEKRMHRPGVRLSGLGLILKTLQAFNGWIGWMMFKQE